MTPRPMIGIQKKSFCFLIILLTGLLLCSCKPTASGPMVVVYTSVDQIYSEPIFKTFEEKTGIRVLPVYDVEAAKTTGLVNRLIAEKDRPQADVFWNNEFAQTLLLKSQGVLAPYKSPAAAGIPAFYLDPEGYWTGTAGRARVLLVNTKLVPPSRYPQSIFDLLKPTWPGEKIGIAYPLFGTTATQAAALYAALGPGPAKSFYQQLHARGVRVVGGNSVVRDLVADGQLMMGLTDSDDACGAVKKGAPVAVIFLDQGPDRGARGTLIIPGTVALIDKAPHSRAGQALIDFLLSPQVEQRLILSGFSQMALRPAAVKTDCPSPSPVKGMQVSFQEIFLQLPRIQKELPEIFIR